MVSRCRPDRLAEQVGLVLVMVMGASRRSVAHTVRIRAADRVALAAMVRLLLTRHNHHISPRSQALGAAGPIVAHACKIAASWIAESAGLDAAFAALVGETAADRVADPCRLLEHNCCRITAIL